jgi:hypothetical protein
VANDLPQTIQVWKTKPANVGPTSGLGGHNGRDEQGRKVVQLSIHDDAGDQFVTLFEGETFEFAGATWQVTTIAEPSTDTRGDVATLTRVG